MEFKKSVKVTTCIVGCLFWVVVCFCTHNLYALVLAIMQVAYTPIVLLLAESVLEGVPGIPSGGAWRYMMLIIGELVTVLGLGLSMKVYDYSGDKQSSFIIIILWVIVLLLADGLASNIIYHHFIRKKWGKTSWQILSACLLCNLFK